MNLHQEIGVLKKAHAIFEAAPWLQHSKNIVHMSVLDPARDMEKEPTKTLPGITWAEFTGSCLVSSRKGAGFGR